MSKKRKKIGIITLHGYYNYGNRLQNYALQVVLSKLGFEVDTIVTKDATEKKRSTTERVKRITKLFRLPAREVCKKILKYLYVSLNKKIYNLKYKKLIKKREEVFKNFTKQYIEEKHVDIKCLTDLAENYDYFITGSDQVWNPGHNNKLEIYFLTFCETKKRLSYAPSFGTETIPKEYEKKYKTWLKEIKELSVREVSGAKIIRKLTGRDVAVLLDPTMLISKEHWLSISKRALFKPCKDYILTYFLGEISAETKRRIKDLSLKYKMDIISLSDVTKKQTYVACPCEFIDYINSASIVITDSFHGTNFSILFEKPFIVYERSGSSMYSRIESLLDLFNLRSREARNIKNLEDILNIDYSNTPVILETERKKAFEYLRRALNQIIEE